MKTRLGSLLLPAVLTLLVGALLVGLGVWQLHRLAWKEGVLAQIAERTKATPQPLPSRSAWIGLQPRDYAYRHVALRGTFGRSEALVFRGSETGAGYHVLAPFALDGGGTVLVDRGFVPDALKDPARHAAAPIGEVTVTGLMREPESRNLFTPADDPDKGQFFTRDPQLIAAHLKLSDAAPFSVDADTTGEPRIWPHGGATEVAIPNNHFSYALTWFGLALGLFGVFGSFAWRRLSGGWQPPSDTSDAKQIVPR